MYVHDCVHSNTTHLVKRAVLQCVKEAFLVNQLQESGRSGCLVCTEHISKEAH